jgi:hypothetical protein
MHYESASFATKGEFKTDKQRDAAMTAASTIDIAWVRPGKEYSGTAQNLARRIDPSANIYQDAS